MKKINYFLSIKKKLINLQFIYNIKNILFYIYKFYYRKLNKINTLEEFNKYVKSKQPKKFLFYKNKTDEKDLEFKSLINKLNINLKDISFLDIGPGYGNTLDICHRHGAKSISFIDRDPFFYSLNHLKGYNGWQYDLKKIILLKNKYDLIWTKGAFDMNIIKKKQLINLLKNLENIISKNGTSIICPHWSEETINKELSPADQIINNPKTQIILSFGYKILPFIEKHNSISDYPVTFLKNN